MSLLPVLIDPALFTRERQAVFLAALAATGIVRSAAAGVGVSHRLLTANASPRPGFAGRGMRRCSRRGRRRRRCSPAAPLRGGRRTWSITARWSAPGGAFRTACCWRTSRGSIASAAMPRWRSLPMISTGLWRAMLRARTGRRGPLNRRTQRRIIPASPRRRGPLAEARQGLRPPPSRGLVLGSI